MLVNSLSPLSFSLSMSVVVLLFFSYTQITALDFFYPYTRYFLPLYEVSYDVLSTPRTPVALGLFCFNIRSLFSILGLF